MYKWYIVFFLLLFGAACEIRDANAVLPTDNVAAVCTDGKEWCCETGTFGGMVCHCVYFCNSSDECLPE